MMAELRGDHNAKARLSLAKINYLVNMNALAIK